MTSRAGGSRLTRRALLRGLAAGLAVAGAPSRAAAPAGAARPGAPRAARRWDTIVVGAGVFGAWTAWHLRRQGQRVLLLDAWGPAHARAASGGESRITRTAYGRDALYTRMAWQSLPEWRWLSERAALPLFHRTGVLLFFPRTEAYVTDTLEVHRRLQLPTQALERPELARRFPQVDWTDVAVGLYEPELGALMARRAVQTLVAEFVKAGGEYRPAAVQMPRAYERLSAVSTGDGQRSEADSFVFACGSWLPKLFPDVLASRMFVTRQEVFYFAPEPGDLRFSPGRLPGWAELGQDDRFYGLPDLESRGFKIANDRHGTPMDPDAGDRQPSAAALADVRAYLQRRFPSLAKRPLNEARVCQYDSAVGGDLLIDRHPAWENVWLVGMGSGHGFKHGPAVGRYAARLATGELERTELRFALASKPVYQGRSAR